MIYRPSEWDYEPFTIGGAPPGECLDNIGRCAATRTLQEAKDTEGLEVLLIACRSLSLVSPPYAAPTLWDADAQTLLKPAVAKDGLLFQHTCDAMYLGDGHWIQTKSVFFCHDIPYQYPMDFRLKPRKKTLVSYQLYPTPDEAEDDVL